MNEFNKVAYSDSNNTEKSNETGLSINKFRRYKVENRTFGTEHKKIRESMGINNQEETYNLTLLMDNKQRVFSIFYEISDTENDFEKFLRYFTAIRNITE